MGQGTAISTVLVPLEGSSFAEAVLTSKGLNVQWQMPRGDTTGICIADLSGKLTHNTIALASHGRSGISPWVLRSVAEDLIRATGDPVLIIPSGPVKDDEG